MIKTIKETYKYTRKRWTAVNGLSYIGYGHTIKDTEKFDDLLHVLYTEALIMEGFQIENPVEFVKKLNNLIK